MADLSNEIKLKIPGISCGSCVKKIKTLLSERFSNLVAKDPVTDDLVVVADLTEKVITIRLTVDRFDYTQLVEAIEGMDPIKYKCTVLSSPSSALADSAVSKSTEALTEMEPLIKSDGKALSRSGSASSKHSLSSLARPSSSGSPRNAQPKPKTAVTEKRKCYITVSGMTCSSCVATIENRLNSLDGIFEAVVALMACRAEVSYDPLKINPEEIAEIIEDMGFRTSLINSADSTNHQSELKLDIMGTSSPDCWHQIEAAVSKLSGVESIQVLIDEGKANVIYYADLIGPRKIVDTVNALGFSAFPSNADIVKNAADPMLEEIAKWKHSFLFSLIFGIPTIVAMGYFGHFWPSAMADMTNDCCVVPGVNWENLILFLLATPVQFYGGRYFYIQVCLLSFTIS